VAAGDKHAIYLSDVKAFLHRMLFYTEQFITDSFIIIFVTPMLLYDALLP
jgi:hypothetical protein